MSNKKPSNDLARLELLIILDYLVNKTNKNHLATQSEINDYSIDKYGIDIKRQRINDCLMLLYETSQSMPDVMKVKIERVSTGKRFKYYVSEKVLSDMDVALIINALNKDDKLTVEETDKLKQKLIDNFSPNISVKGKTVNKISKEYKEKCKKIKYIYKNNLYFEFKVSDVSEIHTTNPFPYNKFFSSEDVFTGYFYGVKEIESKDVALIVIPKLRDLIQVPIVNVEIIRVMDMGKVDYEKIVKLDKKYKNIEDYLSENKIPYGGNVKKVRFTFNRKDKKYILYCFQEMFNKNMEYDIGKKNELEVTINVQRDLFYKWVKEYNLLDKINIVEPYEMKLYFWYELEKSLIKMLEKNRSDKIVFEFKSLLKKYKPIDDLNYSLKMKKGNELDLDAITKEIANEMVNLINVMPPKKKFVNQNELLFSKAAFNVLENEPQIMGCRLVPTYRNEGGRNKYLSKIRIDQTNQIVFECINIDEENSSSVEDKNYPLNLCNVISNMSSIRTPVSIKTKRLLILKIAKECLNYDSDIFNRRYYEIDISNSYQIKAETEIVKTKCVFSEIIDKTKEKLIVLEI